MKDYERHDADASPERAHLSKPQASRQAGPHVEADAAGESTAPAVQKIHALSTNELAHPANAVPLAGMLNELQHSHGNSYVQRVVADMDQARQSVHPPAASQSQSLDPGVRAEMQSRLGEDLGGVRLHTGSEAERLTEALNARAVTHERDVYFARGEYNSATREGKELLAHELTHVIQQQNQSHALQAKSTGESNEALEHEADQIAAMITRGENAQVLGRAATSVHQRQGHGRQPATSQDARQFIEAGVLSSGATEGVHYEFSSAGATFILDFRWRAGTTFVSANPRERCTPTISESHRERIMVTRTPGESLTIEVTFRRPGGNLILTIRLPRTQSAAGSAPPARP